MNFLSKKTLKFVLSCILSVFFLWLAFRNVQFKKLWNVLTEINYWMTIPFVILTLLGMYFRAIRWRWLLKARYDFPTKDLAPPLFIGFALNNLLPMRAGEFARPYALARKKDIPYSTVFATVAAERVVDSLTLLMSLFIVLLFIHIDPEASSTFTGITVTGQDILNQQPKLILMAFILLMGSISLILEPSRRVYEWFIRKLPLLKYDHKEKLVSLLGRFSHGFHSLKKARYIIIIAVYSILAWVCVGFSLQVLSWGFPGITMGFFQGMAVMIIVCIAIMPSGVPGYWGFYEVGSILALKIIGAVGASEKGEEAALGFSLVAHFLQILPIVIVGLFFMWKEKLTIGQIESAEEEVT